MFKTFVTWLAKFSIPAIALPALSSFAVPLAVGAVTLGVLAWEKHKSYEAGKNEEVKVCNASMDKARSDQIALDKAKAARTAIQIAAITKAFEDEKKSWEDDKGRLEAALSKKGVRNPAWTANVVKELRK